MNYFENLLNLSCEDYFIIPPHLQPTQFYTFTFEGWRFTLDYTDSSMNNLMDLCGSTVNSFIQMYKNTHALTQPQLGIKADGTVYIKIATMELESYHQMMEKNKQNT